MMAKKKSAFSGDRKDPKQNKSLAIRMVLGKMSGSKASEVAAEVEKQYGHSVSVNQVYMIKTKMNMKAARPKGQPRKAAGSSGGPPLGAAAWVEAIGHARRLLKATGSVHNATSLLKAIEA